MVVLDRSDDEVEYSSSGDLETSSFDDEDAITSLIPGSKNSTTTLDFQSGLEIGPNDIVSSEIQHDILLRSTSTQASGWFNTPSKMRSEILFFYFAEKV